MIHLQQVEGATAGNSQPLIKLNLALKGSGIAVELATLILELIPSQIKALAVSSVDLIDGIELYRLPSDGITSAMLNTRVDPYALFS
ncbi:MAG: hypothetical protein K0U59_00625 [Gammaproteobacteria bacterium]|nr:hypothetical protein [Gammaproteobacteria bacterium]